MAFGDLIGSAIAESTGDQTVAISPTATEGNLLIVAAAEHNGNDIPATPLGYSVLGQDAAYPPAGQRNDIYWKISDGTETTVTVAYGGSNGTIAYCEYEFDGTTAPTEIINSNKTDTTAATIQAGAVTPDNTPNLVIALGCATWSAGATPWAVDSGFTKSIETDLGYAGFAIGVKVDATGSQNPTWTPDGSYASDAYIAVFHGNTVAQTHTLRFSETVQSNDFANGMTFTKNKLTDNEDGVITAITTGSATDVIYSVVYPSGPLIANDTWHYNYDGTGDIRDLDEIALASFTDVEGTNCLD